MSVLLADELDFAVGDAFAQRPARRFAAFDGAGDVVDDPARTERGYRHERHQPPTHPITLPKGLNARPALTLTHTPAGGGNMASPAPSCRVALAEATKLYPSRSRVSDGIMGDPRHEGIVSDHNDGNAFDLTHDPANGCDAHEMVRALVGRRDPRVKYVISQRRIWTATKAAEGWRPYTGTNPHQTHAHVSIVWKGRDDVRPWWPELHKPKEVTPMFNPPHDLEPIVAELARRDGGVWLLASSGAVYAYGGAPFLGGCNGKPYFTGRKAARLEAARLDDGRDGYVVVATSGEKYGPAF